MFFFTVCPCRSHSHKILDAFDSTPSLSCIAELPIGCLCVYCVHMCVYIVYIQYVCTVHICVSTYLCVYMYVHVCTYNTYIPVCACVCMCVPESALWHGCYICTYIHVKATMVSKTVVVTFKTLSGVCTQICTSVIYGIGFIHCLIHSLLPHHYHSV